MIHCSAASMPVFRSRLLAALAATALLPCFIMPAVAQPAPIVSAKAAFLPARHQLALTLNIQTGYHINSNPASDVYAVPTDVTVQPSAGVRPGKPIYPRGVLKKFAFSEKPVSVYTGTVVVTVPLTLTPGARLPALQGQVRYQACDDRHCLLPAVVKFGLKPGGAAAAAGPVAGT